MEQITKEKVIAEIKELYNDIDKCISDLIAARGNRDGNGISNAHWRMETLMVNTQQAISNVIDTFETKEEENDFIEKAIGWIDYNNRNGGCFEDELLREKSRIYESAIETCRKAMQHKEVPKRKATGKLVELIESIKKKEASMSEEDRWMQMYVMGYNDAISDAVEWLETTFEIMTRPHLSSEVIEKFEKDLRKKDL